jgi:hypothetical protein
MCSFAFPTCVGVKDKTPFKEWFKYFMYRLMDNTVTKRGSLNIAFLCVVHNKFVIRALLVCTTVQSVAKCQNIAFKRFGKCEGDGTVSLTTSRPFVRLQQDFKCKAIFVEISVCFHIQISKGPTGLTLNVPFPYWHNARVQVRYFPQD